MQTDTQVQAIEGYVTAVLKDSPTHFLVEVRIKPTNNIKVFIDGDEGVPLSDLVKYNRRLYKVFEETGLYPEGDFSLELSSPGLDEPLKLHRQYKKNIGRFVELLMNDAVKKEGKLVEVTDQSILIEKETGKAKKKEVVKEEIFFNDIKSTKIQIKF